MFDLDGEIDGWCREIIDCGCAREADLDELKDHLCCLVEEQIKQGESEQNGFVIAIKQMGDSHLITAEYARNRTLLQRIAAYDRRLQRSVTDRFSGKQLVWFSLGYSLFCVVLMVLSAVYGDSENREQNMFRISLAWFIPFIFVVSLPEYRRAECAYFRQLFRAIKLNS